MRGLLEKIFLEQKKETHKKKALSLPSYFRILLHGTSCGSYLVILRVNPKEPDP